MVTLKCPQCGRLVEAPAEMVDAGEKCYVCNQVLQIADQGLIEHRANVQDNQWRGLVLGAGFGALTLFLLALAGGKVGFALAAGVGCALLGVVQGFVWGRLEGSALAVLLWNDAWVNRWTKVCMFLGFCSGALGGLFGRIDEDQQWVVILFGTLGGLILGGLLGAHLGKRMVRANP